MNAILGYAQLLERDRDLGDDQRQKIDIIHSSGSHLLTLINDILEMSKIEAGRATLVLEPFDIRALMRDVQWMFRELAEHKGLELTFEPDSSLPAALSGDAGKVRQVVINLLSNAIKFTDAWSDLRSCVVAADGTGPAPRGHLRRRHGRRDRRPPSHPNLRRLRSGRLEDSNRRHRTRAGHQPELRAADGRRHRRRQHAGTRQHLHLLVRSSDRIDRGGRWTPRPPGTDRTRAGSARLEGADRRRRADQPGAAG